MPSAKLGSNIKKYQFYKSLNSNSQPSAREACALPILTYCRVFKIPNIQAVQFPCMHREGSTSPKGQYVQHLVTTSHYQFHRGSGSGRREGGAAYQCEYHVSSRTRAHMSAISGRASWRLVYLVSQMQSPSPRLSAYVTSYGDGECSSLHY